jgi:3-oxoadipate enol-lactonase
VNFGPGGLVAAVERPVAARVATPPVQAERIAKRIENARLEVVAGADHSSTLEQPDAISQLLGDFLESADAGRP